MFIVLGNTDENTSELWRAAHDGDYNLVVEEVLRGEDPEATGSTRSCTPLHVAALRGHDLIVRYLLNTERHSFHGRVLREQGRVPARRARQTVDVRDKYNQTPLQYAAAGLMSHVVTLLIQYGAAVSHPGTSVYEPVNLAAKGRFYAKGYEYVDVDATRLEVVRILLVAGADTCTGFNWHHGIDNVWHKAIEAQNNTNLLKLLLEESTTPIPVARNGNTIMHEVAGLRYMLSEDGIDIKMLEMLVEHGENPFAKNGFDETPLFFAVRRNKVDTVRYLISLGIGLDADDPMLRALYKSSSPEVWDVIRAGYRAPRCDAVIMSHHPRLGERSLLRLLGPKLLQMVLDETVGDSELDRL